MRGPWMRHRRPSRMTASSREHWDGLLTAYMAAELASRTATGALEVLRAREALIACEDALLAAEAPTVGDAAHQLKIIASRRLGVDVGEGDEGEAGATEKAAIRRMHHLMVSAGRRLDWCDQDEAEGPNWKLLAWPITGGLIGLGLTAAVVYLASHS